MESPAGARSMYEWHAVSTRGRRCGAAVCYEQVESVEQSTVHLRLVLTIERVLVIGTQFSMLYTAPSYLRASRHVRAAAHRVVVGVRVRGAGICQHNLRAPELRGLRGGLVPVAGEPELHGLPGGLEHL